uniref:Uncharacterized protein n=1 Tax=Palpitomonas bilix TaxID=652834 RepID=A0A7S3CXQ2_9EUKA|mmetsp:Transcript_12382/g.33170  ORF Transcript_12382/g.33170 Transcript_12382/m.33170 type:complete len:462 (+) Transcript_12382:191-1576(+)
MWKEGKSIVTVQMIGTEAFQFLPLLALPGFFRATPHSTGGRRVYYSSALMVPSNDIFSFDLWPRAFAGMQAERDPSQYWHRREWIGTMQCEAHDVKVVCGSQLPHLREAGVVTFTHFVDAVTALRNRNGRCGCTPVPVQAVATSRLAKPADGGFGEVVEELDVQGGPVERSKRRSTIGNAEDADEEEENSFRPARPALFTSSSSSNLNTDGRGQRASDNDSSVGNVIVLIGELVIKKVGQAGPLRRFVMTLQLSNGDEISCEDLASASFSCNDAVFIIVTRVSAEGDGRGKSSPFKVDATDTLWPLEGAARDGGADVALLLLPASDTLPTADARADLRRDSPPSTPGNGSASSGSREGEEMRRRRESDDEGIGEEEGVLIATLPTYLCGNALGGIAVKETVKTISDPHKGFLCNIVGNSSAKITCDLDLRQFRWGVEGWGGPSLEGSLRNLDMFGFDPTLM